MNEVVEWLESPEGEKWSRSIHFYPSDSRVTALATIKENTWDNVDGSREEWFPVWSTYFPHGVKDAPGE